MNVRLDDVEEIRFTVVQGESTGSRVTFPPAPRAVRIGRAVENDIVVNDPTVSRAHVRVDITADGARIQDLGSAAGVEKMGFRVGAGPEPLLSGDEFKIGGTILRFELLLKKSAARRPKPEEKAKAKKVSLPPPKELLGGVTKALGRLGLRSPASQILAVAALAAVLVIVFWPSKPGLPPQASGVPTAINYDAVIGYAPGGDESHLDGATFDIPVDSDGAAVSFKVNAPYGLDIRVGKQVVSSLKPTADWHELELLVIPRAVASEGTPQFTLDNLGYSPSQGQIDPEAAKGWAVGRMWVARVSAGATLSQQIIADAKVLEKLSAEIAQDPKDIYRLVVGLRSLTVGVMKLAGRPAVVTELAVAAKGDMVTPALQSSRGLLEADQTAPALDRLALALGAAEGQLNREYRERLNALQLLQKRGAGSEAGLFLLSLEPFIPESTDPRHREIVAQLKTLDAAGRYAYEEAKKKAAYEEGR